MILRLLLAMLVLLGPLPGSTASATPPCPGRTGSGSWTTVRVPAFSSGDPVANLHALSPSRPGLVYVTNGRSVLRSTDGGCRWTQVLSLPAAPTADRPFTAHARVVAMAVPDARSAGHHLHLLVSDTPQDEAPHGTAGPLASGVGATRTLTTEDAGASWRMSGPLAPQGNTRGSRCTNIRSCVLTVAPSDPRVVYVGLSAVDVFVPSVLLRSADAGRTWELRSMPNDYLGVGDQLVGSPGGVDVVEVDPLAPDTIWAKAGLTTFSRSSDGGRSWTWNDSGYDFRLPALDVFSAKGRPSRLVALQSGTTLSQQIHRHSRTTDGGSSWVTQEPAAVGLADVEADGIAHGNRADDVVVSLTRPAGLRGWSPRAGRYVDLDPTGLLRRHAPVSDVQATREAKPRFVLLGKGMLLTYRGPVGADIPVRTTTVTTRR